MHAGRKVKKPSYLRTYDILAMNPGPLHVRVHLTSIYRYARGDLHACMYVCRLYSYSKCTLTFLKYKAYIYRNCSVLIYTAIYVVYIYSALCAERMYEYMS